MASRLTCTMFENISTVVSKDKIEYISCACNCGQKLAKYDSRGRPRRFISGHQFRGLHRKLSEEHKRKLSIVHTGKKLSEEHRRKLSEVAKGEKNHFFGKHHTEESKLMISESHKGKRVGEDNNKWKGDDVGYRALHEWINRHLPPQKLCQICFLIPPKDCACVTRIYNRNFINWLRVCRKCHIILDHK